MTYTKLRPEHLPAREHGNWMDVQIDAGFTCAGKGRTRIYYDEQDDDFWFACENGRHYAAAQVELDHENEPYFVGMFLDD